MTVKFIDVGREDKCWEKQIENREQLTYEWLYKQVKKALMSDGIEFLISKEDQNKGIILVGGFRDVGRFEIVE